MDKGTLPALNIDDLDELAGPDLIGGGVAGLNVGIQQCVCQRIWRRLAAFALAGTGAANV